MLVNPFVVLFHISVSSCGVCRLSFSNFYMYSSCSCGFCIFSWLDSRCFVLPPFFRPFDVFLFFFFRNARRYISRDSKPSEVPLTWYIFVGSLFTSSSISKLCFWVMSTPVRFNFTLSFFFPFFFLLLYRNCIYFALALNLLSDCGRTILLIGEKREKGK